jgi:dihydroxyacetone kinase
MQRVANEPQTFSSDAARGLVLAYGDQLTAVDGGVVRATVDAQPTVAVVVGGGSGHFPTFAGLVGPGLAHAAVLGNVFASPSARQVEAVALEADRGRGVVLIYGNYAGDVLSFDAAQESLRSRGTSVQSVVVTDDIFSAPPESMARRRGVAGDLIVMKVAGAAAAEGHDLAAVVELARRANGRTRTLGVAFGGCTLPGADEPLFEVARGRMAVGVGLHGEPGISEQATMSSRELASWLVRALLDERPTDAAGDEVVVVVNGLGSTKYEELFVLFADVHDVITENGGRVVDAEVGEFVTSFDMAGLSVTFFWPDDELSRLWLAPVEAVGFRRGGTVGTGAQRRRCRAQTSPVEDVTAGSVDSRAAAAQVVRILESAAARIRDIEPRLGHLDALAGDGDHGIGMRRGTEAAVAAAAAAAARGAGLATTLNRAAVAWGDAAGGTSGALWTVGLQAASARLSDQSGATPALVVEAVVAARDAVLARSKAALGDKTLVDALLPFVDTFVARAEDGVLVALGEASRSTTLAAQATSTLTPRIGRARSHPGRSVGIPDPGAVSLAEVIEQVHHDMEAR